MITRVIKLEDVIVNQNITELRSSAQVLDTTFSQLIEGGNKLELVETYNEIKQQYDELLTQYKALLLKNIQSTEESIDKLIETDQMVASDIRFTLRKTMAFICQKILAISLKWYGGAFDENSRG